MAIQAVKFVNIGCFLLAVMAMCICIGLHAEIGAFLSCFKVVGDVGAPYVDRTLGVLVVLYGSLLFYGVGKFMFTKSNRREPDGP